MRPSHAIIIENVWMSFFWCLRTFHAFVIKNFTSMLIYYIAEVRLWRTRK